MTGHPGHVKTLCRLCGTVIAQCRCPAPDKRVEYAVCTACQKAGQS